MALVVKDRVKVSTTTTGTGTITLGAAAQGFQDFTVVGDGNQTYYAIVGGTDWEVGIGTFDLTGGTLSRDTVLDSTNSGSAVDWPAGDKEVFVTYPADKAVTLDTLQTLTNKTIDGDQNTLTNVSKVFNASVDGGEDPTGDWTQASGTDPWIATIAVAGLLSTDVPIVDIDLSSVAFADVEDVQADWALVYRVEASDDDELTLYATDEPTEDFELTIKVVR